MIKIFTDTSANLPEELVKKLNIGVIPFSYSINGVEATDEETKNFDGQKYYNAMRNGAMVKTSMVNSAVFGEYLRKSLEKGDDIIYIGMSGGISGTAQAAKITVEELKEEFPDRKIAAIDTLAASLGEGLQVIKAAEMLSSGATFEQITDCIENSKYFMCQYFTVDDLEYLKRGGRIGKVATAIGTVLKIKPILTGNADGKIVMCGKTRGKQKSLVDLAERYDKLCKDKTAQIGIAHADDNDGADALLTELINRGFSGDCLTVCYEPVTGSHVGPGTVALFFEGIEK